MLTGIELTVPALLVAGLAASPHCALMCAAVAGGAARHGDPAHALRAAAILNGGRVAGYALLGALAGTAGGLVLMLPHAGWGEALRLLAAVALIALGVRHWRGRHSCCPRRRVGPRGMLARGLAWSLLPCPLFYAVLALAALASGPLEGALLAGAFGLGTVPAMAGLAYGGGVVPAVRMRATGGALMVGFGLLTALSLMLPAAFPLPLWCG